MGYARKPRLSDWRNKPFGTECHKKRSDGSTNRTCAFVTGCCTRNVLPHAFWRCAKPASLVRRVRRPCASNAPGRVPLCLGAFDPRAGSLNPLG